MDKKYSISFDAVTGEVTEREYTEAEYAQAALDEGLNGEAPTPDS
jgi:hypothetical protein